VILETTQGALAVAARPRDPYGAYSTLATDTFAGQTVTPEGALSLISVYGAVSLIANTCGAMPLEVVNTKGKSGQRVVEGGKLAPLLRHAPNSEMSGVDLWTMVFAHLLLRGNAYLAKLKDANGFVEELVPLMPQDVTPYRNGAGVKVFRVRVYHGSTFLESDFTEDAILHIKGPSFDDPLVGASPIALQRQSLGVQLAQSEYQARAYQDGMLIKGLLSTAQPTITPETATMIKNQWRSAYGGIGNSHEIAILHSGMTFQPVSMSPEDAQFIQTMKYGATQVATMFSLPASELNSDGASLTYSNVGQDMLKTHQRAFRPRLNIVQAALNRDKDLFGPKSPWVPKFNPRESLLTDIETRFGVYRTGREIGVMSQNDILRDEDRPEIDGGDDYTPLRASGTDKGGGSGDSAEAP
jgi:HK97 family phage portal protein